MIFFDFNYLNISCNLNIEAYMKELTDFMMQHFLLGAILNILFVCKSNQKLIILLRHFIKCNLSTKGLDS